MAYIQALRDLHSYMATSQVKKMLILWWKSPGKRLA